MGGMHEGGATRESTHMHMHMHATLVGRQRESAAHLRVWMLLGAPGVACCEDGHAVSGGAPRWVQPLHIRLTHERFLGHFLAALEDEPLELLARKGAAPHLLGLAHLARLRDDPRGAQKPHRSQPGAARGRHAQGLVNRPGAGQPLTPVATATATTAAEAAEAATAAHAAARGLEGRARGVVSRAGG
jgi:hypothetical protein